MRKTFYSRRGTNGRTRTRSRRYSQSARISKAHQDKFLTEVFSHTAIGWQARTMSYSEHGDGHDNFLFR